MSVLVPVPPVLLIVPALLIVDTGAIIVSEAAVVLDRERSADWLLNVAPLARSK